MVTIKDIAKRLGVTPATVSLALNGKGRISDTKREEIRRVADEMGYLPSIAAKTMRTRQSKTIGVLVGTINNEFFTEEVSAISDVASERGYSIFICDCKRSMKWATENIRALRSRGVDGIITSFGFDSDEKFLEEIQNCLDNGIKVMTLTDSVDMESVPIVNFSSREEIRKVLETLVELGHRNIGCLTVSEGDWLDKTRFSLYREEMEKLGIYQEELVSRFDIFAENAADKVQELLGQHPEITAVFAINDYVAIHAMKGMLGMGKKIPEDISLVGFDGISGTQIVTPTITTICTPKDLGGVIARNLLDSIENPDMSFEHNQTVPASILWGNSVGKVRE